MEPGQSILFVANHTNWWDGFLGLLASARLGVDFRILMDAQNLARYPLFARLGALPLDREHPGSGYRDLRSAAAVLQRPGTGLWVFPQGDRRPPAEPIAAIHRGAAHLALSLDKPPVLWPVAFRYAYLGEQIPEAFIWLGEPWVPPAVPPARSGADRRSRREALTRDIATALQTEVGALDHPLTREERSEFEILVPGRMSINKRLDRVRHFFGLLKGPFERRNG